MQEAIPASDQEHLARGIRRYFQNDLAGAIEDFDAALRLNPSCAEARNNRGSALHARGDHAAALADFDAVLPFTRGTARAQVLKNRGAARFELGLYREACADLDECLQLAPAQGPVHNLRVARLRLAEAQAALPDFDAALRIEPHYAEAFFNRGCARYALGDLAGADLDLSAALTHKPNMAEAFNQRSIVRHNQGDFAAALADADRALALDSTVAQFHHNRGTARLALGDMGAAIADFDEALRLDPKLCVALLGRGNARYHKRDMGGLFDYRAAFKLNPELAAETLVRVFRNDLRRDAAMVFDDCANHLAKNPNDFLALTRRGLTYFLQGKDAEAQADFNRYLQLNPDGKRNLEYMIAEARRHRPPT